MPTIDVPAQLAADITLLAQAWNITPAEVIERLLDRFKQPWATATLTTTTPGRDSIAVHGVYQGVRVEGEYDLHSTSLTITAGPSAGRRFRTPSAATAAVIRAVNIRVNPNRSGWKFWIVTQSGQRLQSLRQSAG